jgi:blue copper oxidase
MSTKSISRRFFLKLAGLSASGTVLAACGARPQVQMKMGMANSNAAAANSVPANNMMTSENNPAPVASANFKADVEISLRATPGEQAILPGAKTTVWHYQGEVTAGDKNALFPVPNSYLGPVMVLKKGQKIRVTFTNGLPEESIVHWHGLHVPSVDDGLPIQTVPPGGTYVYEFEVMNRAGTSWFHPHPDMRTGFEAYMGLAGLILVTDDEEAKLGLPAGEFDVPLVIQDRLFDAQNQLVYPSVLMAGAWGDRILVNGNPDVTLPVAATAYRLRILNGSNMRTYKLAWEDGTPWTVIGTDGGLLEKPVQRPYLTMVPGERVEAWVDFSKRPAGSQVKLVSLPFAGGMMGMGMTMAPASMAGLGNMMGGGSYAMPNGSAFDIMTFKVDRQGPPVSALPAQLSTFEHLLEKDAVNAANPRTFTLTMAHMTWLMNGRTYVMGEVAPDEIVKLNTTEAWTFLNAGMMGMMGGGGMGMMNGGGMMGGAGMGMMSGGMMGGMGGMMGMLHAMHLHGLQFQIIERQIAPGSLADWQTIGDGLLDEGWKDTFIIMPGEQVKFLVRFSDFTGLYMYHCHLIEHEDMGMMRFYRVDA